MSLALRLTLLISVAITAIFLGLGWGIEQSIAHHFAVQDAEELGIVRQSLEKELAALPEDASDERIRLQLAGASHGHHNIFYTVIDASGRTLYARPGASLDGLAKRLPVIATLEVEQLSDWRDGVHAYRGGVLSLPSPHVGRGAYTAVVAAETGFHQHFLSSFQRTVWMATGMAVLLAIGAIWLAVYQGHAPLRKVSARIRGISSDQLHLRLEPQNVPIELAGLTLSFNTMLERIEEDFKRLSHFSADIAHELRTPVTNLITQTQVLLSKERGIEAYREALYSSLEEYERMAKMIGDMLYLAQTDNQLIKPDLADVDLHAEVHALFEYFEPWADERQVQLRIQGQTSPVRGDRLMLRRALSNLLSNAIRHTPAGQTVTVKISEDGAQGGGDILLRISNPGETIPVAHLPHLFDRFYRVDPSRQRNGDGAGLGLAIVKSIVEAHGGVIAVASDAGVSTFTMRLTRT
jgi:two-component system heavy metal sensor histidine kinase CusS